MEARVRHWPQVSARCGRSAEPVPRWWPTRPTRQASVTRPMARTSATCAVGAPQQVGRPLREARSGHPGGTAAPTTAVKTAVKTAAGTASRTAGPRANWHPCRRHLPELPTSYLLRRLRAAACWWRGTAADGAEGRAEPGSHRALAGRAVLAAPGEAPVLVEPRAVPPLFSLSRADRTPPEIAFEYPHLEHAGRDEGA